jgi:hypothetical protein
MTMIDPITGSDISLLGFVVLVLGGLGLFFLVLLLEELKNCRGTYD